jgi:parallel beta-helix repeat protein
MSFVLVLASPLLARAIDCFEVLGPGGRFTLEQDLFCGPAPQKPEGPGLGVAGPATLDLNGHVFHCVNGLRFGIAIGDRATLRNGTITGCGEALLINGQGSSVQNVTVTNNGIGIHLQNSSINKLQGNEAIANVVGIWLSDGSNGNSLVANHAGGNSEAGFLFESGEKNSVKLNDATLNGDGFIVTDTKTQLVDNRSVDNTGRGFRLTGASRVVLKNNGATSNGSDGFNIADSQLTQLIANAALGNKGNGFLVTSSADESVEGNLLQGNSATADGMNGIDIDHGSVHDTIVGNVVSLHQPPYFDAFDANLTCGRDRENNWMRNTITGPYASRSPSCIE